MTTLRAKDSFIRYASSAAFMLIIAAGLCVAQDSAAAPVPASDSVPRGPSIRFTLKFPGSNPESYSIEVWASGRAAYDSMARLTDDMEASTAFHCDFQVASPNRERIFELARRAKYFSGSLDSGRKIAFTGQKTLQYADQKVGSLNSYNYSESKPIQELTSYFQSVSITMEFISRLDYDLRFQKLALDAELKSMEEQRSGHQLEELQAAAPVLQKIVADPAVIRVVRSRAQRLLEQGQSAN